MPKKPKNNLESLITALLESLGEDPNRPGLKETPKRVALALSELTGGNKIDIAAIARNSLMKAPSQDLIIVKGTEFHSLCEHHFLPFFGVIDIAYLPNQHIIGLGTVGRIIETCAQKLHLQENLTEEIANVLETALKPKALMIRVKAQHFCVAMRGIKKQRSTVTTRATRGTLTTDADLRQEISQLLQD